MSETINALHEVLCYAANTNSAMEIIVSCWEGSVHAISTTIAPVEEEKEEKEETDKEAIIESLDLALNDICLLDNWFETVGYRDCPAHKRLLDVMQNIACLHHELTKEAE